MSDYLLQMNGIVKTFDGVKALNGIDIKVRPGECVGLCGENGTGKSTLMKVLSAVYPYGTWDGEILWDGTPSRRSQSAKRKQPVSSSFIRNSRWCLTCRWPKTSSWVMN